MKGNTNVLREPDFRAIYCRAGVSPAIERFTLAGGTPAHHPEVQKQAAFGITQPVFQQQSLRPQAHFFKEQGRPGRKRDPRGLALRSQTPPRACTVETTMPLYLTYRLFILSILSKKSSLCFAP